jgi:uncharacterized protein YjbJ (UPF0337 family)
MLVRAKAWESWRKSVDKDRIAGSAKQIKGSIKEAVGKAAGDSKLQSEGAADQAEGKIQNAVGGLKDTLRDTVRK